MMTQPLALEGPPTAPLYATDDSAPWKKVRQALSMISDATVLPEWPEPHPVQCKCSLANVPIMFYPFDQKGKDGEIIDGSRTSAAELAELLSHAMGAIASALIGRGQSVEVLVPPKASYGDPSMVVRVGGYPLIITGTWLKSKSVYHLLVEAVFRERVTVSGGR